MKFIECPFCFSKVIFKQDGTCPNCQNNKNNPQSNEEIEKNKKQYNIDRKIEIKQELDSKYKLYKKKYFQTKVIPSVFLLVVGVIFSFIIKTGYIWIGLIATGLIYSLYGLVEYTSKKNELMHNIKLEKRKLDKKS